MKTLKACVHVLALVGFAVSHRPCSPEDAYPLPAPHDFPKVNDDLDPPVTSIRVVGAEGYSDVIGRNWSDGSGRAAGLFSISRRSGQLRSLLQKRGDLICMEPASSKSYIPKPQLESLADHGLNIRTYDFHLADGTTGNLDTGELALPDGQTGNFNLEPEQTNPHTASAAASTAHNSAQATTDGPVMTGSSVTPSRGPETGVPQATSMENKISGYAHANISGGRSIGVQQKTMQATTAADKFSNFTFAGVPSSLGRFFSSVTLAPGSDISSAPISSAHVAAKPCGRWSPRILTAGIAIIVGLGFFSLL
ncbi:hypothetical protein MMC22_005095 [Lobaria immixta]|nr:hypothetical protein [Lobaria immixta]